MEIRIDGEQIHRFFRSQKLPEAITLIALGIIGVLGSIALIVAGTLAGYGVNILKPALGGIVGSVVAVAAGTRIAAPRNPEDFDDALTGERMVHPVRLPPQDAGNWVDRTTLLDPRYFPTKVERGVRYYLNPFTTLYHPESEYIADLELERQITMAG